MTRKDISNEVNAEDVARLAKKLSVDGISSRRGHSCDSSNFCGMVPRALRVVYRKMSFVYSELTGRDYDPTASTV